ncbi:hypothetical protein AGABI2DRAFT_140740 [Agaricus bisporus var. bisporus H97]|uniref:hypothetical protein n=1 Tax=Agaricus bisporus var. bisporus (strain H97 / ATCC MYA-4626 / FGSC 10389) TaxID=936046 RepID=UPI00029F6AE2|nr:hypothetical protein AGABI2DRAFT_140740 [Agaricus bisporus var. bisporus H97]EKV51946.1 hypothetical protein AGABI2DRAFT_140740 [Agaricus bisporus var. bisporus H97]
MKKRKASEDLHEGPSDVDVIEALEITRPPEVSEQSKTYTKTAEQASKQSKVAGALGGLKAGDPLLKLSQEVSRTSTPFHHALESAAPIPLDPEPAQALLVSVKARTTHQMGIAIQAATDLPPAAKQQFSPSTIAHQDQEWWLLRQSHTRSMIYHFRVSTQQNWSANSHPDFLPMVKATWDFIFPGLGDNVNHPAIEFLASSGIRSWRSKIGSNTLAIVDALFKDKYSEVVRAEVRDYLPALCFLWKNPEAPNGEREGWLSDLFLKAFVYHVHYMLKAVGDPHGYPVGAVALTAAAIERSLNIWKLGTRDTTPGEFNQQDWGSVTRHYALSTSQLAETKWEKILKATVALIPPSKANSMVAREDLEAELFPADERACVVD